MNHGPTTPETFLTVSLSLVIFVTVIIATLKDAAKVCQEFMTRDPDEIHFTIVALAAAQ